jgi:putative hydrolase of the HAD superfamily
VTRAAARGVLFDMDGVLVFSTEAWFGVYNDTLSHFGHPRIGREAFLRIFGNGTRADRAAYMPERTVEEIDGAYRRFFAGRLGEVALNPEAPDALRRLRASGARTSLATNTHRALAEAILGRLGIAGLLDAFACADEAGAGKPDPAVVRLAESILERLGVVPHLTALACADEAGAGKPDPAVVRLAARRIGLRLSECVLVGDSRYDEEAAAAAPVEFRGYRYGTAPTRIEALSEIAG